MFATHRNTSRTITQNVDHFGNAQEAWLASPVFILVKGPMVAVLKKRDSCGNLEGCLPAEVWSLSLYPRTVIADWIVSGRMIYQGWQKCEVAP